MTKEEATVLLALERQRASDVQADESWAFRAIISAANEYERARRQYVETGRDAAYVEMRRLRSIIWLNARDLTLRSD